MGLSTCRVFSDIIGEEIDRSNFDQVELLWLGSWEHRFRKRRIWRVVRAQTFELSPLDHRTTEESCLHDESHFLVNHIDGQVRISDFQLKSWNSDALLTYHVDIDS
ncbi:hypothetical protein TNCV_525051 [Trichonephila clavipes]|nr:hypothetical protein TNCV_525051 [Trichonephila clavipes]